MKRKNIVIFLKLLCAFCLALIFGNTILSQELYKPSIKRRIPTSIEFESSKGNVAVKAQNVDGAIVVGGDIVVKPANISQAIGIRKFLRWKDGIIPYKIVANHPYRQTILRAIQTLNNNTVLWYKPATSDYSGKFINVTFGNGCHSGIGEPVWGDSYEVSLGNGCNNYGIALQELLHAAGLFHEQQRDDRDTKVRILWDNIQPSFKDNFEKDPWFSKEIGEYNFASIMHYDCFAFSRNGLKTIESRIAAIGQRSALSPGDISAINGMYYNLPRTRGKPQFQTESLPRLVYRQGCIPPAQPPNTPFACNTMRDQLADLQRDLRNETNAARRREILNQMAQLRERMQRAGCN